MKRLLIFLALFLIVLLSVQSVLACNASGRGITATAHWHQTIPIVGDRWPCVEGRHTCNSDQGHRVTVPLLVTQSGATRINTSSYNTVSGSAEVTSASGTVIASGTAKCGVCSKSFGYVSASDAIW